MFASNEDPNKKCRYVLNTTGLRDIHIKFER